MKTERLYVFAELTDGGSIEVYNDGVHGSVGIVHDFIEDENVSRIEINDFPLLPWSKYHDEYGTTKENE